MDFIKYISTPASTTQENPKITTLKLTRGRLTGGFLYFPAGPAGKLHFFAKVGTHNLCPYNTGESYRLDNVIVPLSFGIDLNAPPYDVSLITWNDSTTYSHALTVGFFLDPTGIKIPILKTINNIFSGGNAKT